MSGTHAGAVASPFRQPKAVFAVAFACVVSFMGIGLVDPILPAISHELNASPSEVTLLFTSYLVVTAVAMLITNWVSSRIGAKKTLIVGLILIVLFSAAAGASPSINAIIGFRAGWGVGNALFIATSLAVIVASASGGFAGAIVLYETALGVGIAIGAILIGIAILTTAHGLLTQAERVQPEQVSETAPATGPARGPAALIPVDGNAERAEPDAGIILAAVDGSPVGAPTHGGLAALTDESASREMWRHARSNVLVVNPDAPGARTEWSADAELLRG